METPPQALRLELMAETLRRCPLFGGLPHDTLLRLAGESELRAVPRGGYVFHQNDPMTGCYIVHSGAINVHRLRPDGREQVIRIFFPGESFAEVGLAVTGGFPADAVAVEDSQVLRIDRGRFRDWIGRDPELALRIVASMSTHFRHLVDLLEDLKYKHAEARLAQWLWRRAVPHPDGGWQVELPTTKRLLAGQLGLASETLSRGLARLRELKLVTDSGATIRIPDRAALLSVLD